MLVAPRLAALCMAHLLKQVFKLFAFGQLAATEVSDLRQAAYADGWGRGNATAKRLGKRKNGMLRQKKESANHSRKVLLCASQFIPNPKVKAYLLSLDAATAVLLAE